MFVDAMEGWDAAGLKALATAAAAIAPSMAVALFSRAEPPVVVIAAGGDAHVSTQPPC